MNTDFAGTPLVVSHITDATPEEVWTAWTEAEVLAQWFGPGNMTAEVQALEVHVGGSYRICMLDEDGEQHIVSGHFTVVTPPSKLAMSWAWEGGSAEPSMVTVEIKALQTGTSITLFHEGLDDEARDPHQQGWESTLAKMTHHLKSMT